jgi:AraC-like DNA-binding protein
MGVDMGPPLNEEGNFFEEIRKSSNQLSFISMNGQVSISSRARHLHNGNMESLAHRIKTVSLSDEKFLNGVMVCVEKNWNENKLSVAEFAHELGMSKSQLDRKLKVLSGLSPNDFVKEYRLRKAISLMEDGTMNIAEITMAIGFTNLSYFTKRFRKRFGKAPSEYAASS